MTEKFTTAGRLMSEGQFEKAEDLMSDVPLNIPQGSVIFNALGEGVWQPHQLDGSHQESSTGRSPPIRPIISPISYVGPGLLQTGDLGAYRTLCDKALKQFGETADPNIADGIARVCLMLPPPAASLPKLAKMADMAVAANPTGAFSPHFAVRQGSGGISAGPLCRGSGVAAEGRATRRHPRRCGAGGRDAGDGASSNWDKPTRPARRWQRV